MKVLDLFSGIGGFSLGLERAGMTTVAFCEIAPYCRAVLKKHWPDVPIYDDVRTLTNERLRADGIPTIDLVCGGFPCQDISSAGRGAGLGGERSGLWSEFHRLIAEIKPRYAIIENVSALRARGLDQVLGSLAAVGYDAEWHCIPASAVGAPHQRDRVWIIAHTNQLKPPHRSDSPAGRWRSIVGETTDDCNTDSMRQLQPPRMLENIWRRNDNATGAGDWWPRDWQAEFEALRRMDDGIPDGLDRRANAAGVKAIGNAVVPQIPEIIGRAILERVLHKPEATK